jgi:N-acetylglucosaminyldiphosphoundecaprenol N-acetyl-beta-D-mannosaminyltransferase
MQFIHPKSCPIGSKTFRRIASVSLEFGGRCPSGVARPQKRRGAPVRGAELMRKTLEEGQTHDLRHYLYGGIPGVADAVREQALALNPRLIITGTETPPFVEPTDTELIDLARRLRDTKTDIVWVGLGTPRQDYLVPRLAEMVKCPIIPVGAAFDFLSGRIAEAPSILHATGLEWLYRLMRDPRRLWKRYLFGNPIFLAEVLRERLRRNPNARNE